jgi:two-component sensor histidine kinase
MSTASGDAQVPEDLRPAQPDLAHRGALVCAGALLALAVLGLAGSLAGKRLLDSAAQILVPMAPSTATFFLLLALVQLLPVHGPANARRIKSAVIAVLTGLALLNLSGLFFGRVTGLLDLAFQQVNARTGAPHIDMSPATAALFALVGVAAWPLSLRSGKRAQVPGLRAAGWLGAAVGLWGSVFLLGYVFGTPLLYSSGVVPMARSTALGFILLGAGLVCEAGTGQQPLSMFSGVSTRAVLLRAFVPLVAALSLAHSLLLSLDGSNPAFVGPLLAAGIAVSSAVAVAFCVMLVARRVGGALERAEDRRNEADRLIRTALQEKTMMLKEIHHRVKNNIQIVSSLLSLQSEYVVDPRDQVLFEESQERLKSMALVHEFLYGSADLSSVDMRSYVRQLTGHLVGGATPPVRTVFELEEVRLSVTQCVPCGLLLNELLLNAMKHAFPHTADPMVRVALQTDGAQFELTVEDNGPGLPPGFELQGHKTLGMLLVDGLAQQLHGRLSARNAVEGGALFTLRFPKEE